MQKILQTSDTGAPLSAIEQRRGRRRHSAEVSNMGGNDFQLGRQLELQRQLEHVSKIEMYRRVRVGLEVLNYI